MSPSPATELHVSKVHNKNCCPNPKASSLRRKWRIQFEPRQTETKQDSKEDDECWSSRERGGGGWWELPAGWLWPSHCFISITSISSGHTLGDRPAHRERKTEKCRGAGWVGESASSGPLLYELRHNGIASMTLFTSWKSCTGQQIWGHGPPRPFKVTLSCVSKKIVNWLTCHSLRWFLTN